VSPRWASLTRHTHGKTFGPCEGHLSPFPNRMSLSSRLVTLKSCHAGGRWNARSPSSRARVEGQVIPEKSEALEKPSSSEPDGVHGVFRTVVLTRARGK